ncbi:MAG: hypothetical protein AB1627_14400 [Chloroflexota bacterium]
MNGVSNRRGGWGLIALLVGLVVTAMAAVVIAVVVTRTDLPSANSGYAVSVADGITPSTPAARAAAIARHYLDLQTPELAAPEIHADPVVRSVSAVRAADAASIEPDVPPQAVASDPNRVVWIASVAGDLLNLHDLPWSSDGDPYRSGNIVIDDATGKILGVYPGSPQP